MKFEKKLEIVSKMNLIVNLYSMKERAKIKSYNGKIMTNFHNNENQKKVLNVYYIYQ